MEVDERGETPGGIIRILGLDGQVAVGIAGDGGQEALLVVGQADLLVGYGATACRAELGDGDESALESYAYSSR